MIDWSRVEEIRLEIGRDFDEVVALFLEEVGEVMQRLETLGPGETLAADLHFLKGAALNLGLDDLARLCSSGERQARAGEGATVDLAALAACYHTSREALVRGLSSRPANRVR